ncbi:MAG: membrane-associated phospholipid phosphatase [Gammaproteobacteria bacterium]|jgi:membrane-associated phospholipid phosphatase
MTSLKQILSIRFLFIITCLIQPYQSALADEHSGISNFITTETIFNDYKSLFTRERLTRMGFGFAAGVLFANSNIDHQIQDWYQNDIRSSGSNDVSDIFKNFGERKYLLPIAVVTAGIKYIKVDSAIGNWGTYSLRAYITGTPALLATQWTTGGSRPGETNHKSHWRPFKDSNGVSGHSFAGAVPFLTIAKMYENNKLLKYSALAVSTATTWSRINDNAHYFSQAALGWYLAWESVNAVFDSNEKNKNYSITPVVGADSYGISAVYQW